MITVVGASGGTGASTLCALLAGSIGGQTPAGGRTVAVIDGAAATRSPWPRWVCPGLDSDLGDGGREELAPTPGSSATYPGQLVRRACSAIRGLEGVAILTSREFEPRAIQLDFEAVAEEFDVALIDFSSPPRAEQAARLCTDRRSVLLVIDGSADGVAAGVDAVRAWNSRGVPLRQMFPLVVEKPGGISRPGTARLALLDRHIQPVRTIPHDRAIARLGLAEALAARAVHRSTTQAVRDLASVIATREMVGRPVPARQSAPLAKRAPFTTPSGVTKARSFIPATEGIKK